MEIKTTQEQVEYFEDFLPDNKKGNCNEVMKLIVANNRKWVAQDELIKELDKTWNIINKYKMDRHPNYISKTQVAKFLGDLKNAITSDSRSSNEDSLNTDYDSESNDSTPQWDIEQSSTSHNQ